MNDASIYSTRPFQLRGPAGLFKTKDNHPLCWGILSECNKNVSICPIDIITFHRKGLGQAEEVLDGAIELLSDIFNKFPSLNQMQYSNRFVF